MQNSDRIAVLIRQADRLPEALRIGKRFCLAGMKVAIFVTGDCMPALDDGVCKARVCRLQINAGPCSSNPADAHSFASETASLRQMAEQIAVADLVIAL